LSILGDLKRDLIFFKRKFYIDSNEGVNFFSVLKYMLIPSYAIVFWFRIYSKLSKSRYFINKMLGKLIYYRCSAKYGCDIHPDAKIGVPFKLGHPFGVVVGPSVIIGNGVYLFNDVTLGNKNVGVEFDEMPIVGDNVIIGVGSRIIGGVVVGPNSIIGANSVVLENVGACEVWAGSPAKFIKKNDFY